MKFPTVEKFFCCFRLELGALIMGWWSLLWSTVMLILLTVLLMWTVFSYGTFLSILPENYFGDLLKTYTPILVRFLILISLSYCAVYFYASKRLVNSIKTRVPSHTHLYMILLLLDIMLSLLSILHMSWIAIIQAIIMTIYNGYIFICIYSFYDYLKDEARRTQNRHSQYQSAPLSMYKI
ncbi:hypothetical protein PVAND_005725 [Polypedilum vanderplanki]|uniref:Uncharacterized protein n=1 Tax=Polypedilum vanderplanki TaxID=319348 RepID=A0A9J6C0Y1_POLVA|nr:hypothetical protein PVAND_005725 [Polypedilum vanderplanki]